MTKLIVDRRLVLAQLPKRLRRRVGRFLRRGRLRKPLLAPRFYVTQDLYNSLMKRA